MVRLVESEDAGSSWESGTTWDLPVDFRSGCRTGIDQCVAGGWLQPGGDQVGLVLVDVAPEDPSEATVWAMLAGEPSARVLVPPRVRQETGGFVDGSFVVAGFAETRDGLALGFIDTADESPAYREVPLPEISTLELYSFDVTPLDDQLVAFVTTWEEGSLRFALARGPEGFEVASSFRPGGDTPVWLGGPDASLTTRAPRGGSLRAPRPRSWPAAR